MIIVKKCPFSPPSLGTHLVPFMVPPPPPVRKKKGTLAFSVIAGGTLNPGLLGGPPIRGDLTPLGRPQRVSPTMNRILTCTRT